LFFDFFRFLTGFLVAVSLIEEWNKNLSEMGQGIRGILTTQNTDFVVMTASIAHSQMRFRP
jgi:hypothetical protein